MRVVVLVVALIGAPAHADDYCDHVQAVAAAETDLMYAPELFGGFGYVRETVLDGFGDRAASIGPRVTAGLSYRVTGIWQGNATRARARADCKRHSALAVVQSASVYRGLEARARVLEAALPEAQQLLTKLGVAVSERLATEQEHVAMRLRVDELQSLAIETRRQLAALPPPSQAHAGALASYFAADDDVEHEEARLRKLAAFDVSVRAGYDRYIDRSDDVPYFAMLTFSINTGVLAQAGANARAASARRRMIRSGAVVDATVAALEAELAAAGKRAEQTAALIGDLEAQLATIARLGGDDGRRYRQTLWFDLVKANAERAAATAQVASLRELLKR